MISLIAAAALAAHSPIYHYVRSNRDGTEPEHVVQYRPTRTGIAVYKWVEKCTRAAYVTAEMDAALREAKWFVAGQVAKDGSQSKFGTLTVEGSTLVAEVNPPGGSHVSARHALKRRPFLLYDFDLSDLNAFLQEARPRVDFAFDLPVIWPSDQSIFRALGTLHARYAGKERHLGRRTLRFDLTVEGPTPSRGALWVDARRGFIVEAELGLPNHMEYRDFRLKLARIQPGGQAAWEALTASHYAHCPAGN